MIKVLVKHIVLAIMAMFFFADKTFAYNIVVKNFDFGTLTISNSASTSSVETNTYNSITSSSNIAQNTGVQTGVVDFTNLNEWDAS